VTAPPSPESTVPGVALLGQMVHGHAVEPASAVRNE